MRLRKNRRTVSRLGLGALLVAACARPLAPRPPDGRGAPRRSLGQRCSGDDECAPPMTMCFDDLGVCRYPCDQAEDCFRYLLGYAWVVSKRQAPGKAE